MANSNFFSLKLTQVLSKLISRSFYPWGLDLVFEIALLHLKPRDRELMVFLLDLSWVEVGQLLL